MLKEIYRQATPWLHHRGEDFLEEVPSLRLRDQERAKKQGNGLNKGKSIFGIGGRWGIRVKGTGVSRLGGWKEGRKDGWMDGWMVGTGEGHSCVTLGNRVDSSDRI